MKLAFLHVNFSLNILTLILKFERKKSILILLPFCGSCHLAWRSKWKVPGGWTESKSSHGVVVSQQAFVGQQGNRLVRLAHSQQRRSCAQIPQTHNTWRRATEQNQTWQTINTSQNDAFLNLFCHKVNQSFRNIHQHSTLTVKESHSHNVVRFHWQPVQTEDLTAFLPTRSLDGAQLQRHHLLYLQNHCRGSEGTKQVRWKSLCGVWQRQRGRCVPSYF